MSFAEVFSGVFADDAKQVYCINPKCEHRINHSSRDRCQACETPLLIQERYRLVRPLRNLDSLHPIQVFIVEDWENSQEGLGTLKVMKILKLNSDEWLRLFRREANTLMWLKHEGIPNVEPECFFSFPLTAGGDRLHCLVMEKIEGQSLETYLQENGPISQEKALDWMGQILAILDVLHGKDIIHRDIKPSNIMLRPNGTIALIDFGAVGSPFEVGTRVGSFGYAAPEQFGGEPRPQSDFYALGRTFVHLLTGMASNDLPARHGRLQWRDRAKHKISREFRKAIDSLIQESWKKRPMNARVLSKQIQRIEARLQRSRRYPFLETKLAVSFFLIATSISPFILKQVRAFLQAYRIEKTIEKTIVGTGMWLIQTQDSKDLSIQYFRLTLQLEPSNLVARYNLGIACEEEGDYDCAQEQYQEVLHLAKQEKNHIMLIYTANALARLKIYLDRGKIFSEGFQSESRINSFVASTKNQRKRDYEEAITLLEEGLELLKQDEEEILSQFPKQYLGWWKAVFQKNLGWAYFQLGHYEEAATNLREAIAAQEEKPIEKRRAEPYCLLAQVSEAIDKPVESLVSWERCLTYSYNYRSATLPETRMWQSIAIQRVNQTKTD